MPSTVREDAGVRYAFGRFVVDTERLVVERDGVSVDVQPQVFDVLAYLLSLKGLE